MLVRSHTVPYSTAQYSTYYINLMYFCIHNSIFIVIFVFIFTSIFVNVFIIVFIIAFMFLFKIDTHIYIYMHN